MVLPGSAEDNTPPVLDEQTPLLVHGSAEAISRTPEAELRPSKSSDEESSSQEPEVLKGRKDLKSTTGILGIILVLLLGTFIANADSSIVVATYGTISSEIDRLENGSWLVVTYGLAQCAIQPTYGKLSDIYGRKATLIVAYTFFTIGCALCGAGVNLWQVVLGRAIAGLGGAGMTSLVSVLIADKVPLRDVATWRGYVNIASTIGRSAGGPIGGFLADTIGWRWSFYAQCPLAIIAIVLVAWKLDGPGSSSLSDEDELQSKTGKLRRIDFLGSTSLASAIVGFLLVLDLGGQRLPWTHPFVWIAFAVALFFGALFVFIEAFVAREPIFPLRLLVHRDVVTAYLVTALQGTAQFGLVYTVPIYFQVTARVSVVNAGAHFVPSVFGNTIGGILTGVVIKRTASYRLLTIIGTLSGVLCYALLIFFWDGNTSIWESLYVAPGGFGFGVVQSTAFVAIAAGVDDSQMAIASNGMYLSANIGSLVGASLASNILLTSLHRGLSQKLAGFENRTTIMEQAMSNLEFVKSLEGQARKVVVRCYVQGFMYTYVMSLVCATLATLVGLVIKEHKI